MYRSELEEMRVSRRGHIKGYRADTSLCCCEGAGLGGLGSISARCLVEFRSHVLPVIACLSEGSASSVAGLFISGVASG